MPKPRLNAIQDDTTGKIIVQTPLPPIKYLVLEGGGVRGTAYAGTFYVLEKYGMLKDIEHVAASSVGAIAALFLALGFSPAEARAELEQIPLQDFMEGSESWSYTPSFLSTTRKALSIMFSSTHSLSTGKKLHEWLQNIVAKKLGNKDATFEDLAKMVESPENKKRDYPYKYLHMLATNISLPIGEGEILSHEYKKYMPLALGALASGAFPGAFPAVEYQGFLYVDGGIKDNLPSKIFDKRRYIPQGYDFTDKGQNPSVLAIKIDTQDEINQLIWGVKKNTKITTGRELASAIAVACTETVDVTEIREARMVIPLPDNNIDSLNFLIDEEGKINLVSTAEKITQEFFENHVDTAYTLKIFQNQREWLDSLSLDELDDLALHYEELDKTIDETKHTEKMPTREDIKAYLSYLKQYTDFRRVQKRQPNKTFNLAPHKHITIKPSLSNDGWEAKIKNDMLKRLKVIEKHINITDQRLQNSHYALEEQYNASEKKSLHVDNIFEKVKLLTGFIEYKKVLEEERRDLQKKLGLPIQLPASNTPNKHYSAFVEAIKPALENSAANPPALKVMIDLIDLFEPIIAYQPSHDDDSAVFTLDLRHEPDFKLFMHAALLYLKDQKCKSTVLTPELFKKFYPNEEIPVKDMVALCHSLGVEDVNLLITIYRLEQLMHFFSRSQYPTKKPTLDLEQMLGSSDISFFIKAQSPVKTAPPKGSIIALKNMYSIQRSHDDEEDAYIQPEFNIEDSATCEKRPKSPPLENHWDKLESNQSRFFNAVSVQENHGSTPTTSAAGKTPGWFFGRSSNE